MSTTVILIIAAVIVGVLYFLKRSARLRKQRKKDLWTFFNQTKPAPPVAHWNKSLLEGKRLFLFFHKESEYLISYFLRLDHCSAVKSEIPNRRRHKTSAFIWERSTGPSHWLSKDKTLTIGLFAVNCLAKRLLDRRLGNRIGSLMLEKLGKSDIGTSCSASFENLSSSSFWNLLYFQ